MNRAISSYQLKRHEFSIKSWVLLSLIVTLGCSVTTVQAASCGVGTSVTAVAISFDFYLPRNKGRWITLAATSTDIEWDAVHLRWPTRYKAFKYGDGGAAIEEWRLDTAPNNGSLYDGVTPIDEGAVILDPDELYYMPDLEFIGEDSFGYCVTDSSGRSAVAEVTLHVEDPASYPMPIGIPDPGFGINEEPPADPAGWPNSEVSGFYYVDSDHPTCSNSNEFGFPDTPRCDWPFNAVVGAGEKLVLAASTQPYPLRSGVGWDQINLNGTPANPAWVVGDDRSPDKPRLTIGEGHTNQQLRVRGTGNYRFSGVDFDGPTFSNRESGDNTVLRYSRMRNNPSTGGGGTTVGLGSDGVNVMAFQVNAHDNGIVHPTLADERDIHAFVGGAQQGYWIIDILCSENAGDCVQLTNNNVSRDIYLARATMHSMMENCTDYKDFNGFVVSESDCWDLRMVQYTSGSGGIAQNFYVNDEGIQQNAGYFLNNRSWDTSGQNFGTANVGGRVYFIGNRAFFSPVGAGLAGSNGGGERHFYFNTVYDMRDGMRFFTTGSAAERWAAGNYVGRVNRYGSFLSAVFSGISGHDYNIYGEPMTFAWGSNSNPNTGDFTSFQMATGFDTNAAENVLMENFVDAAQYDFRLAAASDLIDFVPISLFATIAPGLAEVQADLGLSIIADFSGNARNDGIYDVGAGEFPPDGPGSGLIFSDSFE